MFTFGWSMAYLILQRSRFAKERTSIWLLWLVIMAPVMVWAVWMLIYFSDSVPFSQLVGLLLLWGALNWILLSRSLSYAAKQEQVLAAQKETQTESNERLPTHPPRPLSQEEEAILNHCFPWPLFSLHKVEYRLQAVICQGQLRGDPASAYQQIRQNITDKFGDRFLVLFQENLQGKPFFALIPNVKRKSNSASTRKIFTPPVIALSLLATTFLTSILAGTQFANIFLPSVEVVFNNPQILLGGVPYAVTLMLILGLHESGHFLSARFHKVNATVPYFIPWPFLPLIGTLGAFIQIREPIPNRKALFDISFAGPAAGLVVALPLLLWGLAHSQLTAIGDESRFFDLESANPWQSFNPWRSMLLGILVRIALGSSATLETGINLHPVAIAGCIGLIVTALNLMPVGQLDGGHLVHAMFGQRTGATIGRITRVFMLLLSIVQPEFRLWAIILIFIPALDEPALNDVSDLNDWRDILGFIALILLVLIILPMPRSLMGLLG